MAVTLGRNGLAWGRGLHPEQEGPEKVEGDGRAPAGVFAVTAIFASEAADSELAQQVSLPYLATSPQWKAIDDPASRHYNRIVDGSAVERQDWASCEEMWRSDERYRIGAVVAHNAAPPVPGAGSCIFLHVWAAPGVPTAGCTAMALDDMRLVATWLDAAQAPLLVQLPRAEYRRYAGDWGLPCV